MDDPLEEAVYYHIIIKRLYLSYDSRNYELRLLYGKFVSKRSGATKGIKL